MKLFYSLAALEFLLALWARDIATLIITLVLTLLYRRPARR